jgi:hypothetical protein
VPANHQEQLDAKNALERAYWERLERLTPAERLQMAVRAGQAQHRLTIAGLRLRFPAASEEELELRAAAKRVGPRLMRMAFGDAADGWFD